MVGDVPPTQCLGVFYRSRPLHQRSCTPCVRLGRLGCLSCPDRLAIITRYSSILKLTSHTLAVAALMPLSSCRSIAANNWCVFGLYAALPELIRLLTLTTVC
ncbi:hypothetical protein I6L80_21440 (plasmid) [Providencia rettgeri]|uniref:Uncharacterized protein n=1 Tax=Providencia rettgeri TaxID=587 RepID=A0A379FTK4_PRORE|nr:hypothetical protein [Providencia rettgeri]QXB07863.1 hypothetical protein I6L80_21440 [Providencia rettgeri]SUC31967.1 Uncharacterised protein [Providencia rettgeri]